MVWKLSFLVVCFVHLILPELDAIADKASSMIYTVAPGDGYDNPAKEVQEAAIVASAAR